MEGNFEDTGDNVREDDMEFRAILRGWKLLQYADILEQEGWEDPDSWSELDENMLMEMGFKTGHRKKFMKFIRQKYGLNQVNEIKEEKDQHHDEKQAIDPVTKLPFKAVMDQRLITICNENKGQVALISVDIVNLNNKRHDVADTVLQFMGFIMKKQTRNEGIEAFRYYEGCNQFGLIISGRDRKVVVEITENIKKSINDSTKATISMGIAMRRNGDTQDIWFQRAENAHAFKKAKIEEKKAIFGDGNVYEGQYKNKMKHGKGKCVYKNGDVYEGVWENDKKHGEGKMVFADGTIYVGEWRNDHVNGWKDDGKWIWPSGNYYQGQWVNGKQHGQGTFVWAVGCTYTGEWNNGNMHGEGKYVYADGKVYNGSWKYDQRNGYGKATFPDGNYYQGQWVNGKQQGQGTEVWGNGNTYIGEWNNDKQHGQGKCVYANGNGYNGGWKYDLKNGYGEYSFKDGNYYKGEWKNNLYHGQGTFYWADVQRYYQGPWVAGKQHGYGTVTYANGSVKKRQYNNGKLII